MPVKQTIRQIIPIKRTGILNRLGLPNVIHKTKPSGTDFESRVQAYIRKQRPAPTPLIIVAVISSPL